MKNILKPSLLGLLSLALLAAGAVAARAQTPARDARVLVARAGVVNFVTGTVELNHEGETAWRALTDQDELKSGDVVKTGSGGRVEVLLNPGSYFRLGELSQFEMDDASLENLRLKLNSGSAIIEATGYNNLDLSIVINTPQTRVEIVRTGIYRINVLASGVTEVAVWKGRALVGEKGEVVKEGRVARVGAGGDVTLAKLDKKMRDALDLWSRDRGKELAKLNELLRRDSNTTLSSFDTFDYNALYGGVWVFNRDRRCYTFLPYSSSWRSPYGPSYGSWYFNPRPCQRCPSGGGVIVGGGGGGGHTGYGGGGGSGSGSGSGGGSTVETSPAPTRDTSGELRPMPESRPAEPRPSDDGGGRQSMPRDDSGRTPRPE